MNRLSVISAFLGGVKNRYMQYHPDRSLQEKIEIARAVRGLDGLELCYPADFDDPRRTATLLEDAELGISGINVRSRRQGRWLRGAFSAADPAERAEVVDDFRRAVDIASELGVGRISTCPLNDGHDYVFEMNYLDAYRSAEEVFARICEHNREIRICVEYKVNDPRVRCLLGTASEVAAFAQSVGAPNLGATLDFGHSILGGERPAQAAALLHRAGRLFCVHLNDNDRQWDWDMLPGAFHLPELVEFMYYLRLIGYDEDWISHDVMAKEVDMVETFEAVVSLTRMAEKLAGRLDEGELCRIMNDRNPVKSLRYLYSKLFGDSVIAEDV